MTSSWSTNNDHVSYFLNYVTKIQGMCNTLHGLFPLIKNWQMNFFNFGKLIHKEKVHNLGLKGVLKMYWTYNMLMHYLKVRGNLLTFTLWIQFEIKTDEKSKTLIAVAVYIGGMVYLAHIV